jgi:hypothetical protein
MTTMNRNPVRRECKCCSCHAIFTGLTGFDRHWVKTPTGRRCPTHTELVSAGYKLNIRGAWEQPISDKQRAGLAKMKVGRSKNLALDTQ